MPKANLTVSVSERVLRDEFGAPHRTTDKIMEWRISQEFGVVLQLDSPKSESCAYLWMPDLSSALLPQVELERYTMGDGRHSNTHPCPGLEEGKSAIRFNVRSRADIRTIVGFLTARSV